MSMDRREEQELEMFIHEQLRKLPEQPAPKHLALNVMAAVQARQNLVWWKQPFTHWPRAAQRLLLVFLGSLFAGILSLFWHPAQQLTTNAMLDRAHSLHWVADTYQAFEASFVLLLRNMSWPWLAAIAAIFALMYFASLAGVFALYRVASHSPKAR